MNRQSYFIAVRKSLSRCGGTYERRARIALSNTNGTWRLLQLPVGAQLTLQAEAQDYRPGTGRTAGPRRISIIDAEKLDARLADRQTQIVRQLERSLAIEQKNA